MAGRRNRPVGGLSDFLVLLLERGITVREGRRTFTLSLGPERAPEPRVAQAPMAEEVKALPAASTRPRRGRKKVSARRGAGRAAAKKAALPDPRDILVVLNDNRSTGMKLTELAKKFSISRIQMKAALEPLLSSGRAYQYARTRSYFPEGKIRTRGAAKSTGKTPRRGKPVDADAIMKILKGSKQPQDRKQIASKLGVSYHKLIRRMNTLEEEGRVTKSGTAYSIP